MKIKYFLFLVIILLSTTSCKQTDPFVDDTNTGDKFPAPTWVTTAKTVDTSLTSVSWQAVTGAKSYEIAIKNMSTGALTDVNSSTTSASFSVNSNGEYQLKVRVKHTFSSGAWSNPLSITFDVKPPQTPSSFSVTSTSTDGRVSFTIGNTEKADGYKLYYADNSNFTNAKYKTLSSTSYYLDFNYYGPYYFKVSAYNIGGESAASSAKSCQISMTPSFYSTVDYLSDGSYKVKWTNITNATKYEIEESYNSITNKTETPYTSKTYSHSYARTYTYRVRAITTNGTTPWSRAVTHTVTYPQTPTLYQPTLYTTDTINVSWSSISNATEYQLYMNDVLYKTTSYTSAKVQVSTTGSYRFTVKSKNLVGTSGHSDAKTIYVDLSSSSNTDPYDDNNDNTDPYGDDETDPFN